MSYYAKAEVALFYSSCRFQLISSVVLIRVNKRLFVPVPQQPGSREGKEQQSLRMLLSKGSQLRGRTLSCPSSDQQVALFLDCLPILLPHSGEGWVTPRNVPDPTQIIAGGNPENAAFPQDYFLCWPMSALGQQALHAAHCQGEVVNPLSL